MRTNPFNNKDQQHQVKTQQNQFQDEQLPLTQVQRYQNQQNQDKKSNGLEQQNNLTGNQDKLKSKSINQNNETQCQYPYQLLQFENTASKYQQFTDFNGNSDRQKQELNMQLQIKSQKEIQELKQLATIQKKQLLEASQHMKNLENKYAQSMQMINQITEQKNKLETVNKEQESKIEQLKIKILSKNETKLLEEVNKLKQENQKQKANIDTQKNLHQQLTQMTQLKNSMEKKKNEYQSKIELLNNEILELKQQNNLLQENELQLIQKNEAQQKEILSLTTTLKDSDNNNKNMSLLQKEKQDEIKKLTLEIEKHNIIIEQQSQQNMVKETNINELNQSINNYQQDIKNLEEKIQQLISYQQEKDIQNHFIPEKEISQYYDEVIVMGSIQDLENDQNLAIDSQEYDNKKHVTIQTNRDANISNKTQIVVCMQGQRKTGKTELLKSLMNQDLPSHFHENTLGISIKYETNRHRNITYLDTQGTNGSIPIDYESNVNYQNFMINNGNGLQDDKNLQIINKFVSNKHQFSKITEQMLQEFAISNSHIIIIVVSNITTEDINLIYSIQQYLDQLQSLNKKKIYVVHNLKDYHMQRYVEEYIQSLKTQLPLRQQQTISYSQPTYKYNCVYIDNIYKDINHLFMAHQGSEAGNIYNKFTVDYLKAVIAQYSGETKFNALDKFKDYLNNNIQRFVTLNFDQQIVHIQKQDLIELRDDGEDKKIIYLNKNYTIGKVKELQMNIFGSMQKDYTYSIVKNDKKLYLFIDIPGSVDIKVRLQQKKGQFTLKIKQNEYLEQNLGQILLSNRKHYEIQQKIQICRKNKIYKYIEEESKYLDNGVYQYVFEKEPEQDEFD
ncbi:hypothetical protein ABPG74_006961 [Tetrahymena malaccensis]